VAEVVPVGAKECWTQTGRTLRLALDYRHGLRGGGETDRALVAPLYPGSTGDIMRSNLLVGHVLFALVVLFFFCGGMYMAVFTRSIQRRALERVRQFRSNWPRLRLLPDVMEQSVGSEWFVMQYRVFGCLSALVAVLIAILYSTYVPGQ
jgi:hypothetical protein